MNALIARLGQLETRRTAQTIWNHGKKKRAGGPWMCVECRQQSRHKRVYSDWTLRWRGAGDRDVEKSGDETARQRGWSPGSDQTTTAGEISETGSTVSEACQASVRPGASPVDDNIPSDMEEGPAEPHDTQLETIWAHLEADGLVGSDSDDAVIAGSAQLRRAARWARFRWEDLPNFDYKAALAPALEKSEADLVAQCLFAAESAKDVDFVGNLSDSSFSAILRLLQPENFVNKLASLHVDLSAAVVRYMHLTPMSKVALEYATMLEQIFLIRRSKGRRLGLPDYKILLRGARDLGDKKTAKLVWAALHDDGHSPDTACFNYYMASVVWNGVHNDMLRQRRRAIPHNLSRRENKAEETDLDYRVGHGGVRDQATSVLGKMLKAGVIADEQSFVILMTAAALEGDMKTVKSFLKKVWSLDVDALLAGKSEEKIKPRPYPVDSPLRPTGDFLVALAQIFGLNNDIPAALRVIDFVARQYSIDVPEQTWGLLFEWTFVLARNRTGTSRNDGSKVGELPGRSLMRLWRTMTGAPYFIKPSMGMYNFLIKNLFRRAWPPAISVKIEEAHEIYMNHRAAAIESRKELTAAIFQKHEDPASDVSLENLRKRWEYLDVIRRRDMFWLKRWVRLLLGSIISWNRLDNVFVTERIPSLLWKWRELAPQLVQYETTTGIVEFEIRTEEDMQRNAAHIDSVRQQNELLREAASRFVGQNWLQGKYSMSRREQWLNRRRTGEGEGKTVN